VVGGGGNGGGGGGGALRCKELELNAAASRWSTDATVPGAICYQEFLRDADAAAGRSGASPQLRLLTAATLKSAALAATRAGEAVLAPADGAGLGAAFAASGSDDSDDSSDGTATTTVSETSWSSDAAASNQSGGQSGDIESGSNHGTTATDTRKAGRFPSAAQRRPSPSLERSGCSDVSDNLGPCVRKLISVVCCPVRISAKACGKAAKCIERAVDVDAHDLRRQMAS
jgi:hypothetical protein